MTDNPGNGKPPVKRANQAAPQPAKCSLPIGRVFHLPTENVVPGGTPQGACADRHGVTSAWILEPRRTLPKPRGGSRTAHRRPCTPLPTSSARPESPDAIVDPFGLSLRVLRSAEAATSLPGRSSIEKQPATHAIYRGYYFSRAKLPGRFQRCPRSSRLSGVSGTPRHTRRAQEALGEASSRPRRRIRPPSATSSARITASPQHRLVNCNPRPPDQRVNAMYGTCTQQKSTVRTFEDLLK
jgi:hypothetical protein